MKESSQRMVLTAKCNAVILYFKSFFVVLQPTEQDTVRIRKGTELKHWRVVDGLTSIDLNNSLKLPCPKPPHPDRSVSTPVFSSFWIHPIRWMISKKNVGRSPIGFVNSCNRIPSSSASARIPSSSSLSYCSG